MIIAEALQKIRQIQIRAGSLEVFETAAQAIAKHAAAVLVKRARHNDRLPSCACDPQPSSEAAMRRCPYSERERYHTLLD